MLPQALALTLALASATPSVAAAPTPHGNVHDFDFEFGSWTASLRVRAPLSTANHWKTFTGTSTVKPFWNGASNYGELNVHSGSSRIVGLTLRLYRPKERRWFVYFSNSADGELGTPLVGGFAHGIGTFYDREQYRSRPVLARFVFSDVSARAFQLVQSYSPNNGQTWIPNWEANFRRD